MEIQNIKLTRAKVSLQKEKPFFAYLIMNMKFKKENKIDSIGVNILGDCFYNEKFIDKLNEEEVKGVLAHEVMHLVLEHFIRSKDLDNQIYNIASDLCVNSMLRKNSFSLPNGLLEPNWRDEFEFETNNGEQIIENISKKTANQIYHELIKLLDKDKQSLNDLSEGRFDKHIDVGDKALTKEEKRKYKNKWKKAVSEASAYARDKGNMPEDLELFVDDFLDQKINWKSALYKYLTRVIPHDYTYARPSRRSHSVGVYMPTMRKESIEIVVSLDTSASINKKELTEFLTEINGIAKSFNGLNMKLIVCDSEIKEVYTIGNGDSDEIAKLSIKGGGGTSHKPVYDYVLENIPNTKLLINFTDGYTDFDELDDSINSLWVICKNGVDEDRVKFGEVIKLN